jgi:hypothetical protein
MGYCRRGKRIYLGMARSGDGADLGGRVALLPVHHSAGDQFHGDDSIPPAVAHRIHQSGARRRERGSQQAA